MTWWTVLSVLVVILVLWLVAWRNGWLPESLERVTRFVLAGLGMSIFVWVVSWWTSRSEDRPRQEPRAGTTTTTDNDDPHRLQVEPPRGRDLELVEELTDDTDDKLDELSQREVALKDTPPATGPDPGVVSFLRGERRGGRDG